MIEGRGRFGLVLAMFQQDRFDLGMSREKADEFGAAIAAETDNTCLIFIHRYE
jgi:hypothetical protein